MALSGTIADWSFADILQVISAQQKSGTLSLVHGSQRVTLTFAEGKIARAELHEVARQSGFVRFLVDTGRIAPVGARKALALAQQSGNDPVRMVEAADLLPGEHLQSAFDAFVQELIYQVLQWDEGEYEFGSHPVRAVGGLTAIPTEGLLFEGMRRIDEWARIAVLVQPDTVFCPVPGVVVPPELARRERALLRLVDGVQDVRALNRLAPLTPYEVGESLTALHALGLIDVASSDGAEILELDLDDLEPVPRLERVLRLVSLTVLVVASLLFGFITHGADWAGAAGGRQLSRQEEAVRFALELYRDHTGRYPRDLEALEETGIPLARAGERLVYRPDPSGEEYTLIEAVPPAAGPPWERALPWR